MTFSASLPGGLGSLALVFDRQAWRPDGQFQRDVDSIVEAKLDVGTDLGLVLGAGTDVVFNVSATAEHRLEVIWPEDESEHQRLASFGVALAPTEVGVRLVLEGTASATAGATVPAGALRIGLTAGGGTHFTYERFKVYGVASSTPRTVVADLLNGLRLPTQVVDVATLPAEREVLTVRYGGYLQIGADVSLASALTSSRGMSAGDLALDFRTRLTRRASTAAKYRVAGDFEIHCCRAGQAARFVVRKARASQFDFAADLRLEAGFSTSGLPDTAPELLGALLGLDVDRLLRAVDKVQNLTSVEAIRKAIGDLAADALGMLAQPLINKALDLDSEAEFVDVLREVSSEYTSADGRITELYQDSLDDLDETTRALAALAAMPDVETLKAQADTRTWELFRRLSGDRLHDALFDPAAFAEVVRLASDAHGFFTGGQQRLKQTIATLRGQAVLGPMLDRLGGIVTAERLASLGDAGLRRLVSLLLDKPFDRIAAAAEPSLRELQAVLARVESFNSAWYGHVVDAARHSYTFDVNYAFTRASSSDALIDVEIDVGTSEGQRLARRAAVGDFSEVLGQWQSPLVRIRDAVLTHRVRRETRVAINVVGFTASALTRLLSSAKTAFRSLPSGLVLVYTTEAELQQERTRGDEQILSSFLLRAVAEAQRPDAGAIRQYLVDTLRSMSASYSIKRHDARTSVEELREYLAFAEFLGLLPDRAAFVAALQRDLPDGWDEVSLEYVVRYDETAVAAVFLRDTAALVEDAREAMRRLIASVLIAQGQNHARLGLAYQSDYARQEYRRAPQAFTTKHIGVTLPVWVTKDKAKQVRLPPEQMPYLEYLFRMEERYLAALAELDRLIDDLRGGGAIRGARLTELATKFVSFADDMPADARINPFFGIFDALVAGAMPRGRRSVMILELVPRGGASDEKVTKMLSSSG